ncbi:MAG: precorrin-8X methylmutase [Oscillibacter sp.]|nr:precorrin-8X methylmutase [Oscillibacter sp.]
MNDIRTPAGIERESMRIIDAELSERGIVLAPDRAAIVKRVIHATADFAYAETLYFTPDAPSLCADALRGGVLVTDTDMALAGISKATLRLLGGAAYCFMASEDVAREARERNTTRAAVSVDYALERYPGAAFAVGNAPTALLRLAERIEAGARPAFVIGVPVGFVNVAESKRRIREVCGRFRVPAIVADGRKGGSTVAAAVCNALLYAASGTLDPGARAHGGGNLKNHAKTENSY